jgi:OmcA/MtrC family decaheme c-type cytochrome
VVACTSCHDDVDPSISENHPGRPKTDFQCLDCHESDEIDFDEDTIVGVHTVPRFSDRISGVNFEIVNVEAVVPGSSPAVTFRITNNAGEPIAPEDMDYLALSIAGPSSDYTDRATEVLLPVAEDAPPPPLEEADDGAYRYTFQYILAADAEGTYAVSIEGYVNERIRGVNGRFRIPGFNPVYYVAVDDSAAVPRREVISSDLCNSCHGGLAQHGDIRQNTEYCVMCHNANATDEVNRPADAMPPTSVDFRILIHRIHRGEEAARLLQIYGFEEQVFDYSHVAFPANLANCETCHFPGTYDMRSITGLRPTTITQGGEPMSTIPPIQSVCTACHDSTAASGHAELQTTANLVETCEVCHGPGREFDALEVHP